MSKCYIEAMTWPRVANAAQPAGLYRPVHVLPWRARRMQALAGPYARRQARAGGGGRGRARAWKKTW